LHKKFTRTCAGVAQPGLECQTLQRRAILIIWRSWVRNPPPALHYELGKLNFLRATNVCSTITLKARFNGKCVECNEPIKVGKEIVKNSKGNWVHKFCSDIEEELP